MKLKEAKVHNFGKLNDCELHFEDGVNIIYGPNESGKTTLHEFIKGMFYGITRQRGRAARNDLYTRYEPWDNGSYFSGILRFESGGKDFRITRNFYKNDVKEEFVCETDGERLSVADGDMDVLLGDISEVVFENTLSVGQMRSRTDESLYQELRNYMANYEGSGDWELDINKAIGALRQQKKEYEGQYRAELAGKETKKKELQMNIAYLQKEIEQYEEKRAVMHTELESKKQAHIKALDEARANQTKEEVDQVEEAKGNSLKGESQSKKSIFSRMLFLSPILLVMAIELFFFESLPVRARIVAAVVGVLAAVLWWISSRNGDKEAISEQPDEPPQKPTKKQEVEPKEAPVIDDGGIGIIEGKLSQLVEIQEEKRIQLDNCQMDYWDYSANISDSEGAKIEIEALQSAMESISEVSAAGARRMEKEFHQRISEILSEITNGRYNRVVLDEDNEIELYSEGKLIALWTLSKGTIEQVYFALRMAAAEIFCDEDMPVLLDDVFALYDEERLAAVLAWLGQNKKQVIVLTCSTREAEIAQRLALKVNQINL